MPHNEIPSAFLIRALARHQAHHCDRCGHRMFVKGSSGLCPFCLSERPARPAEQLLSCRDLRHGRRDPAACRPAGLRLALPCLPETRERCARARLSSPPPP